MTRVLDSKRPNLDGVDPAEVNARRRIAAEQPVPRAACPGCLRDLRPFVTQARRGWCRHCYSRRDDILHDLLRVTDPRWRMPTVVKVAREHLARLKAVAAESALAAEKARREAAQMEADLRYLQVEHKVCIRCNRSPAGATHMCRRCQDTWEFEKG